MAEDGHRTPATPGGSGSTSALAPGQRVGAGRYTLIRQLGQGGMGMVWLAKDEQLGEEVALKFLLREISHDADSIEELRRETLKSRKLTHPNITRIHDLCQPPGEAPFISMEFIQGTPLSTLKAQQEQRLFPWTFLQPLVKQLCDALDYAHKQKVIHRDLKPANMMVNGEGELRLADFGIAAAASESMSRVSLQHNSSGTPAYMSPQQMDGRPPKVTDDVYALGVTLYELLTSKPPFYHGDIAHQVRNLAPDPLEQRLADLELNNDIPPDVAALIMACLAKAPEQRPQSAGAVAEWIGLNAGAEPGVQSLEQRVSTPLIGEIDQSLQPGISEPEAQILREEGIAEASNSLEAASQEASGSFRRDKRVWVVVTAVAGLIFLLAGFLAAKKQGQSAAPAEGTISAKTPTPTQQLSVTGGRSNQRELRCGILGLDTSHVQGFTKMLNDPKANDYVPGGKVLAAFKGGSPDIESSAANFEKYGAKWQTEYNVKIYDSIEELCRNVDAVFIESVDGRTHLRQSIPVIQAGKPLFIDKPMAASLTDAIEIFKLAEKHKVPVFSSSALRFGKDTVAVRNGSIGKVISAETTSPAFLEPHHPDLFWYGIHGVESLFTVMGPGCETVQRRTTPDGKIEVIGTWKGNRTGTFRESKDYGGSAKGEHGEAPIGNLDGSMALLTVEIVKFFQTGVAPVPKDETIEILAFMEAADESKRQGGKPVKIAAVIKQAGYTP